MYDVSLFRFIRLNRLVINVIYCNITITEQNFLLADIIIEPTGVDVVSVEREGIERKC